MIHTDLVTQLQLLIKTSAPPLLEVSQQLLEAPQLVPGQKVSAVVVANLPNGRFEVSIADKTLDMNLPKNTQPGDSVELVFVTARPRPTFVLANDLGKVANPAGGAAHAPQVSLSETARFLGGLLEKIAQPESGGREPAAGVARQAPVAPLLAGAPDKTLDLAQALRGALTRSGLFYESHQAQWVSGERPLSDLLREPQGRLSAVAGEMTRQETVPRDMSVVVRPAMPSPSASPAIPPSAQPDAIAAGATPQPSMPQPSMPQQEVAPAGRPAIEQPAHPDTLPIVRQQLDALDTRQVAWQGQVWPGQEMEWRIEERGARERGAPQPEQDEWRTSLRLHLPHLGDISATLTLYPGGVRVRMAAADSASASLLDGQRAALQQGMEASGLRLEEMKVEHG